jgi:hypothetical protein
MNKFASIYLESFQKEGGTADRAFKLLVKNTPAKQIPGGNHFSMEQVIDAMKGRLGDASKEKGIRDMMAGAARATRSAAQEGDNFQASSKALDALEGVGTAPTRVPLVEMMNKLIPSGKNINRNLTNLPFHSVVGAAQGGEGLIAKKIRQALLGV